jgi:hypothetical protein
MTQNTNHYLWFVITSQNTFVISKRAHYHKTLLDLDLALEINPKLIPNSIVISKQENKGKTKLRLREGGNLKVEDQNLIVDDKTTTGSKLN